MKLVKENIGDILKSKSDDEIKKSLEDKFLHKILIKHEFFDINVPDKLIYVTEIVKDDRTARAGDWYATFDYIVNNNTLASQGSSYLQEIEKNYKEISNLEEIVSKLRGRISYLNEIINQITDYDES